MTEPTITPVITIPDLEARGLRSVNGARENDTRSGPALIAGDCLLVMDDATPRIGYAMWEANNIDPNPVGSNMPAALGRRSPWAEKEGGGYGDHFLPYPFDEVRDGLGIWWYDRLSPLQRERSFAKYDMLKILSAWRPAGRVGGTGEVSTATVPRRVDVTRQTPVELAIGDVMRQVEALPPDTRLTDALVLLQAARSSVGDYVDGVKHLQRSVSVEEVFVAGEVR